MNYVIFLCTISFVILTTAKNHLYYSREISILNQGYVKIISEDDIKNLLSTDSSAMLYIDGGDEKESRQANMMIRRYAYYSENTVNFFYDGYKIQELSKQPNTEWTNLSAESLPVLFYIENGYVKQTLYYDDIIENFASWVNQN